MKQTILCIDDEIDNVDALERIFRKKYHVIKAISGHEGLTALKNNPNIAVIISDQRMPKMTGVEFFRKSLKSHPNSIRILLTGYTDLDSVVNAINSGEIYRYLTKPWDSVDLSNTVDKAVEKFELRQELVEKNLALTLANEELKTLDQTKTQFMMLINHELKTPLTSLLSFQDLLSETKLDDEQKMFLDRIKKSSNRLQLLINEVLELVSAETGQLKVNIKHGSLTSIIEKLIQQKNNEKNIKITLSSKEDKIKSDLLIIESVLSRLLDNALKFTPNEGSIEIGTEKNSDNIKIYVNNTGPAMDQKIIDRILKPFSLNEDMLHHSKGLGMGLSICQAKLKLINSQLNIESSKGIVSVSFLI